MKPGKGRPIVDVGPLEQARIGGPVPFRLVHHPEKVIHAQAMFEGVLQDCGLEDLARGIRVQPRIVSDLMQ